MSESAFPWGLVPLIITVLVSLIFGLRFKNERSGFGLIGCVSIGLMAGAGCEAFLAGAAEQDGSTSFVAVGLNLLIGSVAFVIGLALYLIVTVTANREEKRIPTPQP